MSLLFALTVTAAQECADSEPRGLNAARFDKAQAWLDGYADKTGMVFVVQRDGHQKIFTAGMRDRESKTPMTEDTLFRVCSMTCVDRASNTGITTACALAESLTIRAVNLLSASVR